MQEVKEIMNRLMEIIQKLDQDFSKDEASVKVSRIIHIMEAKGKIVKALDLKKRKDDK